MDASAHAETSRALEAIYAAGHWLLCRERPRDAASVFRGMTVLDPHDERAWLALGACHEALEHKELALEMYGVGQLLCPRAVRTRLARARLLDDFGRSDEADAARASAEDLATDDDAMMALVASERGAS